MYIRPALGMLMLSHSVYLADTLSGGVDVNTKIFTRCVYFHISIHMPLSLTTSSLTIHFFSFQILNQPAKTFATVNESVYVLISSRFYFQTKWTTLHIAV